VNLELRSLDLFPFPALTAVRMGRSFEPGLPLNRRGTDRVRSSPNPVLVSHQGTVTSPVAGGPDAVRMLAASATVNRSGPLPPSRSSPRTATVKGMLPDFNGMGVISD
jgi:hypothetical protein